MKDTNNQPIIEGSLIGKPYVPCDNSYCKELKTGKSPSRPLAGRSSPFMPPVETVISSEVYEDKSGGMLYPNKIVPFVNVTFEGNEYRVLFYNHCVRNITEKDLIRDSMFDYQGRFM